jgi:hypothetical protein
MNRHGRKISVIGLSCVGSLIPMINESDKRLNLVHDKRMKPIMNINDLNTIEQLELKWSTKTGHFLKRISYRIPVQIPTGISSLMLKVFVYHYKTPNNQ